MKRFGPEGLVRGTVLAIVAIGLSLLLSRFAPYLNLSRWVDDAQHRLLGPTLDMRDVVIVDIDEESIEVLKPRHGAWPYARDLYARLVHDLKAQGVRTIAFDILLAETRSGDAEFAATLNEDVVLAAAAFPRPPLRSDSYLSQIATVALNEGGARLHTLPAVNWPDVTLPVAAFTSPGKARVGIISVHPDDDGVLRRLPLFHATHGRLLASFPLASWVRADVLRQAVFSEATLHLAGRTFAVDTDGQVALRFPKKIENLVVVPFHQIVAGESFMVRKIDWRDKIVMIGSSSILFGDYTQTPVGRTSGLVLSAVVSQSLVQGHVLMPVAPWITICLILLAVVPSIFWLSRSDAFTLAGFGLAMAATVAVTVPIGMALFRDGQYVQWLSALSAGTIALMLAAASLIARMHAERERLAYERRAAEDASRMKGEFLAHMAHELRTPLTAIMGYNKINRFDDQLNEDQRRHNSEAISRNCEYLLALINDNLDLATMEAGQLRLRPASHAIEDLVKETIDTLTPLTADKPLQLSAQFERPLPDRVLLDAVRVRQILINLIGNAIKFTPSGLVEVTVRWHAGILDLSVIDTGPGMDAASVSRLFEPYQSAAQAGMRREGSTGLGLSIARRLARLMGGDLSAASWPGKGSRFRLQIPATVTSSPPAAAMPSILTSVKGTFDGRVLLAEDDEDIRALLQRELEALGLSVRAVENGLQVIEALENDQFDVLFMDLEMPVMNGLEAVQVLRAKGNTLPLLGLTAHTQGERFDAALAHGFDAVLSKPVSTQALAAELNKYLRRGTPAPPSSPFQVSGERV